MPVVPTLWSVDHEGVVERCCNIIRAAVQVHGSLFVFAMLW